MEERRYLLDKIADLYTKVLPYERARLAAFRIAGDSDAPIHVKHDLSKLTDGELTFLAKIIPKLAGATGGSDPQSEP